MQFAWSRRAPSRLITGTVMAVVLTGAGSMREAHADIRPQTRRPLMALLEPEQSVEEPVPVPMLILERTDRRMRTTGDPIWDLKLEIPGETPRRFDAVSGRSNRQNADRDRLGSRAPLPIGNYSVGVVEPLVDGAYPEIGPVWISIEPTFTTGRRVLGIHLDPSAGLRNANSGTLGCIGLVNRADMLELAQLIERTGTRRLDVVN